MNERRGRGREVCGAGLPARDASSPSMGRSGGKHPCFPTALAGSPAPHTSRGYAVTFLNVRARRVICEPGARTRARGVVRDEVGARMRTHHVARAQNEAGANVRLRGCVEVFATNGATSATPRQRATFMNATATPTEARRVGVLSGPSENRDVFRRSDPWTGTKRPGQDSHPPGLRLATRSNVHEPTFAAASAGG